MLVFDSQILIIYSMVLVLYAIIDYGQSMLNKVSQKFNIFNLFNYF